MITKEYLKNLILRKEKLYKVLEIKNKETQVNNLEKNTQEQEFWEEPKKAQIILKQLSSLKIWLKAYNLIKNNIDELQILIELEANENELELNYKKTIKSIEDLEFKNMLNSEEDNLSAIMTITPGAGGTESQDWAEMIMRMYIMWGEKNNYKIKTLDLQKAEPVGIKSITLEFEGDFSYGYLKSENGVHRLVRISPFDSNSKRHTSFASIFISPVIDDDIDIIIEEKDIRIDTYRASGAGGQHVNKTDSAVRITHIETGIVVQCQNQRSQLINKNTALKMLQSKLYQLKIEEMSTTSDELINQKKDIGWGSQIRSYVFHPYNLVKDHRTKHETSNIQAVMDGDIDSFIRAYLLEKMDN